MIRKLHVSSSQLMEKTSFQNQDELTSDQFFSSDQRSENNRRERRSFNGPGKHCLQHRVSLISQFRLLRAGYSYRTRVLVSEHLSSRIWTIVTCSAIRYLRTKTMSSELQPSKRWLICIYRLNDVFPMITRVCENLPEYPIASNTCDYNVVIFYSFPQLVSRILTCRWYRNST